MSNIRVFDTDANELPHAVNVRGERCTIQLDRGNFTQELRLTVDEAQVLREELATWLFHGAAETGDSDE
jgi:hypothetical protein